MLWSSVTISSVLISTSVVLSSSSSVSSVASWETWWSSESLRVLWRSSETSWLLECLEASHLLESLEELHQLVLDIIGSSWHHWLQWAVLECSLEFLFSLLSSLVESSEDLLSFKLKLIRVSEFGNFGGVLSLLEADKSESF